ncbi:MAG: bifunctional glycosyltransferase family 2 protein/CDP-glycerol:glycerophosphate glycerophosphotransferase [Oscillospiraceae bacterium]|jgi:glycosyltransferase involved in cell wall biosynthesis|nr:bifunctional glycosyltransferase family 2 protein/CDP-glycerol:glycerophosphate glycerophosphotransferase [Oscillospiraceae bacterium]
MPEQRPAISLIIPVYNVAKYLRACLASVAAQTMPAARLEVLLINDGSTDESPAICEAFAAGHPNVRYFSKENEGLSATRNYGIRRATGKYLMFLDSDDTLSRKSCEALFRFFEAHANEVDLVAYPHLDYVGGKRVRTAHYRYHTLNKSGVYDLMRQPYLAQTFVSVCTKNRGDENILFDTAPEFRHEDQKYCTQLLQAKWKLGFCAEAEYCYNKDNGGGIVSTLFHAYYIFESTTRYFEELFAPYGAQVPPYLQGLFLNDLHWKLQKDILFPYHYDAERFAAAKARIAALLARVDTRLLLEHPAIPKEQQLYWLRLGQKAKLEAAANSQGVTILADGLVLEQSPRVPLVIRRQQIWQGRLEFLGYIDSAYFTVNQNESPTLFVCEDGVARQLALFDSLQSLLHPMLRIGRYFAFRYSCNAAQVRSIRFFLRFGKTELPASLRYQPFGTLTSHFVRIASGGYLIARGTDAIRLRKGSGMEQMLLAARNTLPFWKHPRLLLRRAAAVLLGLKKQRIWLYNDLYSVETDNGYLQFQHDFAQKDGVKRYYVTSRRYENPGALFSKAQQACLVQKDSLRHMLLYLSCERILTAYFGRTPVYPFSSEVEELQYEDLMRFRVTYLQHGVLHAALHSANHAERCRADEVVVSTPFEFKNYQRIYQYEPKQLCCTGMARYDRLDRKKKAERRILFAPSWRKYLTHQINPALWEPVGERIRQSDYYRGFQAFLTHPALVGLLEEQDLHLDVKLHPILSQEPGLFESSHPRIHLLQSEPPPEQYLVFVTDFSSYLFDFVYLGRCIQYFLPDKVQFLAGMNHYRALDLPLEEGFGPVAYDAETAVAQLKALAVRGFVPEDAHGKRMEGFFFPLKDCAGALYQNYVP